MYDLIIQGYNENAWWLFVEGDECYSFAGASPLYTGNYWTVLWERVPPMHLIDETPIPAVARLPIGDVKVRV